MDMILPIAVSLVFLLAATGMMIWHVRAAHCPEPLP